MRIGHGYDVHRLVEGRKLILGGVDIPYKMGSVSISLIPTLITRARTALNYWTG